MFIITAIPIYKNKFQKPILFFSKNNFLLGSIIFVPFPKKNKPAIVLEIDNLENKKALIRRNKIKINKMDCEEEIPLIKKEIIEIIKKAEEKTEYSFEEIFQKIIKNQTIKELNKIKPTDEIKNIKKSTDKLSLKSIREKLKKNTVVRKTTEVARRGLQTIDSVLNIKEVKKTSLHTEKHYLVNEIRNYFGETAKKGKGSFGFYLGFFGRVPKAVIYQYWAEVKQSPKSIKDQQKLFWWKMGQHNKNKKKS